MRFEAFISYSHMDKAAARWLQSALEGYRLPSALRRGSERRGGKLRPVFRDDTELASSTDLTASILDALAQSAAVIVICSPRAAKSRWTNEEIHAFRRMAPERPILPLIIDGSPDPAAEDCAFPPALLRDEEGAALPEPLAADLRPEADGKRGALLKLVAGLLGVSVDALRQRDQQRRLRFMGGVTAGALAVSVITIALAISADRARSEAELRRDQAEGLIDFMLVELRGKLEPIGRLDVLDAVGDEAIEYFSALGELGTETELLNRALALRQIGEIRFAERDFDAALSAFAQSRELTRALHERAPADNDVLFELSQAEFWVGYVDWSRGDLDGATTAFESYYGHSQTLFARVPTSLDYKLELTYALSNLASLARARGQADEALAYITEANALNAELLVASPENDALRAELAQGYSWEGSIRADRGELMASESALQKSHDIYKGLHEGGSDKRFSHRFAEALALISSARARLGRLEEAEQAARRCVAVGEELVAHDPDNAAWQRNLFRCHHRLIEYLWFQGKRGEAHERLSDYGQRVAALGPVDRNAHHRLSLLILQARSDLASGRPLQAGERAARALTLARSIRENERLLRAGLPLQELWALDISAHAHDRLGQESAARVAWMEALQLIEESGVATPEATALRARLHHATGDTVSRDRLLRELATIGYEDPRYLPTLAER